MRTAVIASALFFSTTGFSSAIGTPDPTESGYIKQFRKMCAVDTSIKCDDYAKNIIMASFNFDLEKPKRVFYVTPEVIEKGLRFLSDQEQKKNTSFGQPAPDPVNDYIQEMEYQRNVISYLETACVTMAGSCLFLATKVKLNAWAVFVYSGCGAALTACKVRGDDSIKRYEEEIKQIKEICKEGADTETCLKRVEKGKKAKLLPADNPPPRPEIDFSDPPPGEYNPGGTGGDGGWTSVPGMKVCVSNTIIIKGGPLGETAEEETVCYDI